MKKIETVLKQFCSKLTVDNLQWVCVRLEERVGDDIAEVLNYMSSSSADLDKWLGSTKTYNELYDLVDLIHDYLVEELANRTAEVQKV